jgi:hypothetical protein
VGQVTDLYVSADIESDGPIPGEYSMLSFGLAVAGTFDGTAFHRAPADAMADAARWVGEQAAGGRRDLPASLVPDAPHTHNALDDAIEQGEILARLFAWDGP